MFRLDDAGPHQAVGIELKPSYYRQALKNLEHAAKDAKGQGLLEIETTRDPPDNAVTPPSTNSEFRAAVITAIPAGADNPARVPVGGHRAAVLPSFPLSA